MMANLLYLFRFFQVVPPIPRLLTISFMVITAFGAVATVLTGDADGRAVVPVVVLQAFSASTGFAAPARRGYFDVLIARGESRARIAVVQWVTAIAPGMCSWLTIAGLAALVHGLGNNAPSTSGTAVAFALASTVPWATTVSLPRFSGAIGWLLVVCLGTVGGVIWPDSIRDVVFPVALVGRSIAGRSDLMAVAAVVSAVSVALALAWVHRTDIPLEAAQ